MSESLNIPSGESVRQSAEPDPRAATLESMAGEFDLKKAEGAASEDLKILDSEKEEVLTTADAAKEYLGLLDELSQDFTLYKDNSAHHTPQYGFVKDLGKNYSDDPNYHWFGYRGTEADPTSNTIVRMAAADNILEAEIDWRREGDPNYVDEISELSKKKEAIEKDYQGKSFLERWAGRKQHKMEISRIDGEIGRLRWHRPRPANMRIAEELDISYGKSNRVMAGGYERASQDGIGPNTGMAERAEIADKKNEELNRRFFGFDDPERAAKIERAIELRKQYADEWSKEMKGNKKAA